MPFSCGTEAADWMHNNCERCSKYCREDVDKTECDFSNKVAMGFFGAGPSKEEAEKYNCTGDPRTECSQIILKQN